MTLGNSIVAAAIAQRWVDVMSHLKISERLVESLLWWASIPTLEISQVSIALIVRQIQKSSAKSVSFLQDMLLSHLAKRYM